MRWWEGRLCGLDLETTAADPEEARIVSVAVVVAGGGAPTETWTSLVNPGVEIPAEATEVHGISNDDVATAGISVGEALAKIAGELRAAMTMGWPVIAHNMRYDFTVADREARREGSDVGAILIDTLPKLLGVDPIVIDRHLDRYRPKRVASHSLEDCCRVWNVPLEGAHDATYDALAAVRLAYWLAKRGNVIRRTRSDAERAEFVELCREWESVRHDLPALFEWQRRIAWADAVRLEAYFHAGDERKGVPPQPDRHVAREWPIIPVGGGRRGPVQESAAELLTPEWTT